MGIFKDPESERLEKEEWLTYATERVICPLTDKINSLQYPFPIPQHIIEKSIFFYEHCNTLQFYSRSINAHMCEVLNIIRCHEKRIIEKANIFNVLDYERIDLKELSGIAVTANVAPLRDIPFLLSSAFFVDSMFFQYKNSHLNAILDVFANLPGEVNEFKKKSATRDKKAFTLTLVMNTIKENRWNIKNTDLMINVAEWAIDYLKYGGPYPLMMLSRLKVMSRKGKPIYSMEDV